MAICLEGYSSHCSFMERHKALVAACDILKSATEMLVSEGAAGPTDHTAGVTALQDGGLNSPDDTQEKAHKRPSK